MSEAILVGVTARPVSARAVDWAADRALQTGASLTLVSVVGGAVGAVGEDEVVRFALAGAEALVDQHRERVERRGLSVHTRVLRGNPTEQLTEASKDADLLVIGSDFNGAGHERRGPHGRRIVAGAHCPVVVVPDFELEERSGVVVGVDGSEVSTGALEFAVAEASRTGEVLTVVSAWVPVSVEEYSFAGMGFYPELYLTDLQDQTEAMVDALLDPVRGEYPGLPIRLHVTEGAPDGVLNGVAGSARLAVLGTHGRGGLARLLLGSVSERVLSELATVTAVVR